MSQNKRMDVPFPALTPAQRYYFDVNGYVIIENTLSSEEVKTLKDAMYSIRDACVKLDNPGSDGPRVNGAYLLRNESNHHFLENTAQCDPRITAYLTHPRLVGMAEEVMGCEARILESNGHINSKHPDWMDSDPPQYGLHRGVDIPSGSHEKNGLFHCNFIKTLTWLTDIGPDDGGTVCVAGSHKTDLGSTDVNSIINERPELLHKATGPAGSTMLFAETLIHGTGRIYSNRERCIIIGAYGPRQFLNWHGYDGGPIVFTDEFQDRIPSHMKVLFNGLSHWARGAKYRTLADPVDGRAFPLGVWNERASAEYNRFA